MMIWLWWWYTYIIYMWDITMVTTVVMMCKSGYCHRLWPTSNDVKGADDELPFRLSLCGLPCCSCRLPCQLLSHYADAPVKHWLGKLLKGMTCSSTQGFKPCKVSYRSGTIGVCGTLAATRGVALSADAALAWLWQSALAKWWSERLQTSNMLLMLRGGDVGDIIRQKRESQWRVMLDSCQGSIAVMEFSTDAEKGAAPCTPISAPARSMGQNAADKLTDVSQEHSPCL